MVSFLYHLGMVREVQKRPGRGEVADDEEVSNGGEVDGQDEGEDRTGVKCFGGPNHKKSNLPSNLDESDRISNRKITVNWLEGFLTNGIINSVQGTRHVSIMTYMADLQLIHLTDSS